MVEKFRGNHSPLQIVKEKGKSFIDARLSKVRDEPAGIHDPNWRKYFPFPKSFENTRFHHWAKRMDRGSRKMLVEFIEEWGMERLGLSMSEIIMIRVNPPPLKKPALLEILEDFLDEEERRGQNGEI